MKSDRCLILYDVGFSPLIRLNLACNSHGWLEEMATHHVRFSQSTYAFIYLDPRRWYFWRWHFLWRKQDVRKLSSIMPNINFKRLRDQIEKGHMFSCIPNWREFSLTIFTIISELQIWTSFNFNFDLKSNDVNWREHWPLSAIGHKWALGWRGMVANEGRREKKERK